MDFFRCETCGLGIRPQDSHTVKKVSAWIYSAGSGKKVHSIDQDHYRYMHDYCLESLKQAPAQEGFL
jgi:hypothetical protein